MVCAAERRGGGRGEAGSGRTKEAENITKVSAASQFARSKRGLVSGPRAGNKKGGPDEQIKLPSTAPCTRLSRVEGTHGAPFVQGTKGTPLFENRSRVSPRKIKIIYIFKWKLRDIYLWMEMEGRNLRISSENKNRDSKLQSKTVRKFMGTRRGLFIHHKVIFFKFISQRREIDRKKKNLSFNLV